MAKKVPKKHTQELKDLLKGKGKSSTGGKVSYPKKKKKK